ncbi:hypothetical protein EON64_03040 [archaeon]|nr:MAG: hypothetical protein EON64_03040 [archaeon]
MVYGASTNLGIKLRRFIIKSNGETVAQRKSNKIDISSSRASSTLSTAVTQSSPVLTQENERLKLAQSILSLTYKTCLGKYCMDGDFKDSAGKALTRVGILSPDDQWIDLADLLRGLRHIADSKDSAEFVPSTHVPPYGYGRNHGYSRIIRIADDIPAQASALIQPIATESSKRQLYEVQVLYATVAAMRTLLLTVLPMHCRSDSWCAGTADSTTWQHTQPCSQVHWCYSMEGITYYLSIALF